MTARVDSLVGVEFGDFFLTGFFRQDINLLLRLAKCLLALPRQLNPPFELFQCVLKRQVTGFHTGYEFFKLFEGLLKSVFRLLFLAHIEWVQMGVGAGAPTITVTQVMVNLLVARVDCPWRNQPGL